MHMKMSSVRGKCSILRVTNASIHGCANKAIWL